MEILILGLVSFAAGFVTLYSGFGLGTILLPVYALFLPLTSAISATAVVHFLNNLFKFGLVYKKITWNIVVRFGITASIFSILGSLVLVSISGQEDLLHQVIGALIVFFALFEILPNLRKIQFSEKLIPLGGVLSGFFGGLSGHQGAFRSMFLLKTGLNKDSYIADGVMIALIVDISRIVVYGLSIFSLASFSETSSLNMFIVAVIASFAGSYLANKFSNKITISLIKVLVSVMMLVIGLLIIFQVI